MNRESVPFALMNRDSRTVTAVCRDLLNICIRKENVLFFPLDRPGQRPPSLFFKDLNSLVLFIFTVMNFTLSVWSSLPGYEKKWF